MVVRFGKRQINTLLSGVKPLSSSIICIRIARGITDAIPYGTGILTFYRSMPFIL